MPRPAALRLPAPCVQPQTTALQGRCPHAAQVFLKWNAQRGVAVIPKAQAREHSRANIEGFFDWALSDDQKVRGCAACAPRELH